MKHKKERKVTKYALLHIYHYKIIYHYNKYALIMAKSVKILSMKEAKKLSESRIQKAH